MLNHKTTTTNIGLTKWIWMAAVLVISIRNTSNFDEICDREHSRKFSFCDWNWIRKSGDVESCLENPFTKGYEGIKVIATMGKMWELGKRGLEIWTKKTRSSWWQKNVIQGDNERRTNTVRERFLSIIIPFHVIVSTKNYFRLIVAIFKTEKMHFSIFIPFSLATNSRFETVTHIQEMNFYHRVASHFERKRTRFENSYCMKYLLVFLDRKIRRVKFKKIS